MHLTHPQLLPATVSRELSVTWDFFATSHGKGSVDGVGGGVKRGVRQEVVSRREVVKNSKDFASVAARVCPNVTVLHIGSEEIEGASAMLEAEVFSGCKVLQGTRQMHHMVVTGPSMVTHSRFKGASVVKHHKFK